MKNNIKKIESQKFNKIENLKNVKGGTGVEDGFYSASISNLEQNPGPGTTTTPTTTTTSTARK